MAKSFTKYGNLGKEERLVYRENRQKYLFYPEDKWFDYWQIFISIALIFASISTPYRIAFV